MINPIAARLKEVSMSKRVLSAALLIVLLFSMVPSALAEDAAGETAPPLVSEEPAAAETPLPPEEPAPKPTDTAGAGGGCYSIMDVGRATGLRPSYRGTAKAYKRQGRRGLFHTSKPTGDKQDQ